MTLRNVTITLDEETARWVRIEAARQDTSVSKLVGALLRRQMDDEQEYERAFQSFLSRGARTLKDGAGYPRRDELHDRAGLR